MYVSTHSKKTYKKETTANNAVAILSKLYGWLTVVNILRHVVGWLRIALSLCEIG